MEAKDRRVFQMGKEVSDLSHAHPLDSPDYVLLLGELDGLLVRGDALIGEQRGGINDRHAAALRKRELVGLIRTVHLPHLARAAERAADAEPTLAAAFRRKPSTDSYKAFVALATAVAAAAEQHQEVLAGRGMSARVLDDLKRTLAEFAAAIELGNQGRAAHVGASAELRVVAQEVVKRVRLLDAVNRLRFRDEPKLLAAWESVSRVQRAPQSGAGDGAETGQGAGSGDVRPAA
jgi:hypothetical protein